jgi:hypothetical protein
VPRSRRGLARAGRPAAAPRALAILAPIVHALGLGALVVSGTKHTPEMLAAVTSIVAMTWFLFAWRCDEVRRVVAALAASDPEPEIPPRNERRPG